MDAGGNGGKRPFGPHGEGCECEWEDGEGDEPGDEEEAMAEAISGVSGEFSAEDPVSPEERAYARALELSLHAMAADFAENFLAGLDACAMDGNTLNRRQVIAMIATMMTGYESACQTAKDLERGLKAYALQARRLRKQAEAEARAEEPTRLHDVSSIFTVPSKEEQDDTDDTDDAQ